MRLDQGWKGCWVISTLKVTLDGLTRDNGAFMPLSALANRSPHTA